MTSFYGYINVMTHLKMGLKNLIAHKWHDMFKILHFFLKFHAEYPFLCSLGGRWRRLPFRGLSHKWDTTLDGARILTLLSLSKPGEAWPAPSAIFGPKVPLYNCELWRGSLQLRLTRPTYKLTIPIKANEAISESYENNAYLILGVDIPKISYT